jgi:hypothetical protein
MPTQGSTAFTSIGFTVIVTGVQSVGAKGVSTVQVTAADPKDLANRGRAASAERDAGFPPRAATTQPVAFPRGAVALDHRPVHLRSRHAAERYHQDGGGDSGDGTDDEDPDWR